MKTTWRRIVPSRRWLVLPPVIVGVASIVAFARTQQELPRNALTEQPRSLPVVHVAPTVVVPQVRGFGTSSTARRWEAVAEVQGRVVEIHPALRSGNAVAANSLLVRIDATDSELVLSRRLADLDSAQAKLEELETAYEADEQLLILVKEQLAVAISEEERLTKLERARAASQSAIDQARSSRLAQQQAVQNTQRSISLYPSQIKGAKAAIALAQAQVREAEQDIERTRVYSPFAGVLSGVELEVGQFVKVHEPLFELLDREQIEVVAQFSLEQIEKLFPSGGATEAAAVDVVSAVRNSSSGMGDQSLPFTAHVIARSGDLTRTWAGRPIRIAESLNVQSRTLGIVVEVTNPARDGLSFENSGPLAPAFNRGGDMANWAKVLRPGTFCEVILESPPRHGLFAIPRSAVDGDHVYLVDGDNRLRRRRIITGFAFAENVTVIKGLADGDVVAAVAPVPAIEGQLVDPQLVGMKSGRPTEVLTASGSDSADAKERRQ